MGTAKHHATQAKRFFEASKNARSERKAYLYHRAAVRHSNMAREKQQGK